MMRMARAVSVAVLALAATACGVGVESTPEAPAGSLAEVSVPADFTFATSRTAALSVSASDAVLAGQQDAALVVSRPDGVALFKGAVRRGVSTPVEVPVALEHETVDLQLMSQGVVRTRTLALRGGQAEGRFE
jgi:hypothetical protein